MRSLFGAALAVLFTNLFTRQGDMRNTISLLTVTLVLAAGCTADPGCVPTLQTLNAEIEADLSRPELGHFSRFLVAVPKGRSLVNSQRIPALLWETPMWFLLNYKSPTPSINYATAELLDRGILPTPWITEMHGEKFQLDTAGKKVFDQTDISDAIKVARAVHDACYKVGLMAPYMPGWEHWDVMYPGATMVKSYYSGTQSDIDWPSYSNLDDQAFRPEMQRRLKLVEAALPGAARGDWLFGLFADYEAGPYYWNGGYEAQKKLAATYPADLREKFFAVETSGRPAFHEWIEGRRDTLLFNSFEQAVRDLGPGAAHALAGNYRSLQTKLSAMMPVVYGFMSLIYGRFGVRTRSATLHDFIYFSNSESIYYGQKHLFRDGDMVEVTEISPAPPPGVTYGVAKGQRFRIVSVAEHTFRLVDQNGKNVRVATTTLGTSSTDYEAIRATPVTLKLAPTAPLDTGGLTQALIDRSFFEILLNQYVLDTEARRNNPEKRIVPWVAPWITDNLGLNQLTRMSTPYYKNLLHHMLALGGVPSVAAFSLLPRSNGRGADVSTLKDLAGIYTQERMTESQRPLVELLEVLDELEAFSDLVRAGEPFRIDTVASVYDPAGQSRPCVTGSRLGDRALVRVSRVGVDSGSVAATTQGTAWVTPWPDSPNLTFALWGTPEGLTYMVDRKGGVHCGKGLKAYRASPTATWVCKERH